MILKHLLCFDLMRRNKSSGSFNVLVLPASCHFTSFENTMKVMIYITSDTKDFKNIIEKMTRGRIQT